MKIYISLRKTKSLSGKRITKRVGPWEIIKCIIVDIFCCESTYISLNIYTRKIWKMSAESPGSDSMVGPAVEISLYIYTFFLWFIIAIFNGPGPKTCRIKRHYFNQELRRKESASSTQKGGRGNPPA